jgi:dipeptidyl aminopeptidase/acylaminoacyl peptidase
MSHQVMLYLPPGYQAGPRLPMLVEVYGGPGFQKVLTPLQGLLLLTNLPQVDKQWQGYSWAAYVAGTLGIVYAVIDPRGSGFQGDAWRHAVYRQFGTVEVEDTISVTAALQSSLPYVDSQRTAIWGWSYGGYLRYSHAPSSASLNTASLSALARDTNNVFSCGVSVAPVVR